jgi:hypothetical protein
MPVTKETEIRINLFAFVLGAVATVAVLVGGFWAVLSKIDTQTANLNSQVLVRPQILLILSTAAPSRARAKS